MITRHVSPFQLSFALAGLLSLAAAGVLLPPRYAAPPPVAEKAAAKADYGQLPLYFVANEGQTDPRVAYYLQGRDKSVAFTDEGLTFVLSGREAASPRPEAASLRTELSGGPRHVLRLDFVGARRVRPEGEGKTEAVFSYFKGEKDDWRAGVASYARLVYRDLWPGIDLEYAGTVDRMKYTFRVKPGADPSVIKLAYRGADGVRVNEVGELEVSTPIETFHDERPVSFQEVGGKQVEVATSFSLGGEGDVKDYGFAVGDYDRSLELVIDPALLVYAGFVGGDDNDGGLSIAVDSAGNAYVTGDTPSTEATFPVAVGPDLTYNNGNIDAFVAKVKADGTGLLYCGYIGGAGTDFGRGIAVDAEGHAYVSGTTWSTEATFPVTIGPDLTHNGGNSDAFVAKLTATGADLLYCGYLGGVGSEDCTGIAVDAGGNAYLTGDTQSTEATFPEAVGPDLTYNGGMFDAFVAKVSADGTALLYCGYLGGTGTDDGSGIAVDAAGNAYLTGGTSSAAASFPVTVGPDLTFNGAEDAFVAKVSASGAGLLYCGYIGGGGEDSGRGIAVGAAGNAYVTGETSSNQATFPVTVGPDLTFNGDQDAFVAKVSATGVGLLYCGYLGGVGSDRGFGIGVDAAGNAYLTGDTTSTEATFPATVGPDLTYNGGVSDAFVAKVTADGSSLAYRGYIGGGGGDIGRGIAVDSAGNAYVTGRTDSSEATFPDGDGFGALPGPDQNKLLEHDAFVVKVAPDCVYALSPSAVNFSAESGAGAFSVSAVGGCSWDAESDVYWITVSGAGSGPGDVEYFVWPNTGALPRIGTITVAGATFTVRQGVSFQDVDPDDFYAPHVGRLSAAGITLGCGYDAQGNLLFCPEDPVTREQMAAFISRALGVFNPPPPAAQAFADVPPESPFYAFVEQMRVLGITIGCGGGNFCPGAPVTREQMSAFIIRALGEPSPPPPSSQRFLDVPPANPFYSFVDRLAERGITLGCSSVPPLYCPAQAVTRGQMAVFLVRAFGL